MEERYITLAIHTYDYAVGLHKALEENGIAARLENVDLEGNSLSSGVRVRIPLSSLPFALKIVESSLSLSANLNALHREGLGNKVLVPIDFSDHSYMACHTGFAFAYSLGVEVTLLNVYSSPYFDGNVGNSDNFNIDVADNKARKDHADAAHVEMLRFVRRIRKDIIDGLLPAVKFSTETMEGVPEDAILDYARNHPPVLIVMATRGANKKATDTVGSVTAEVIDSCRFPIFTVPENSDFSSFASLNSAVFFCNVNQQDLLAIDTFLRLMDNSVLNIHLIPVSERAGDKLVARMSSLQQYCAKHYPKHHFVYDVIEKVKFRQEFERYIREKSINVLVVPNKKQNAFSRLFNPSIAHKVVFERDIPMLVLPV